MDRTIKNIFEIKNFNKIFKKLMIYPKDLTHQECGFLLSTALVLLKYYDSTKMKVYFDLSYYIILKYAISYKDYRPLYDLSLNMGLYSVSSYVYDYKLVNVDNFTINLIEEEIKNIYKKNGLVFTKEQYDIRRKLLKDKSNNLSFIVKSKNDCNKLSSRLNSHKIYL